MFSGFFKKLKNDTDNEDKKENTLIEDLFEAKKNRGLNWGKFISDDEEKQQKTNEILEHKENVQEVKIGNTIISSDTMESDYNIKDILREKVADETMKVDTTKKLSENESKTEVMDSLKKFEEENKRDTVTVNSDDVRTESFEEVKNKEILDEPIKEKEEQVEEIKEEVKEETKDKDQIVENDINENIQDNVTERLLEQKVNNNMEDTQLIDTGKVRSELYKLKKEEVEPINDFEDMYKKVFGTEVSTIRKNKEEESIKLDVSDNIQIAENIENETVFDEDIKQKPSVNYKFIGTIFQDYAIIEVKDEMYMIEKSAAEERLMYEIVKEDFYSEKNVESVTLLLADIVTLAPKEMSMARELSSMFNKIGFEYDEFGENTLKLIKVPSWAESLNTKKLFLEILKDMNTVAITATKEKEEKFISTVSNKYVEFLDTRLDEKELEDLIRRLLSISSPFMYPNGKLTAVKISRANMEKKFSRR